MRSLIFIICLTVIFAACSTKKPAPMSEKSQAPSKENIWVFMMAGQSNMAGRGTVEAEDKVTNARILSIDSLGNWKLAQEPLHFYEPNLVGLDCGLSFGKELLKSVPDSVTIALIPTAVGGSAISQWINDENYRNVDLLSNFKKKVDIAKAKGTIKGILWHQGESDAHPELIPKYKDNMQSLFSTFRSTVGNQSLPIMVAELGSFYPDQASWDLLNAQIRKYVDSDSNCHLVNTDDLMHKGDSLHFNSASLRRMGQRFASQYDQIK